jgi:hypothetical protein
MLQHYCILRVTSAKCVSPLCKYLQTIGQNRCFYTKIAWFSIRSMVRTQSKPRRWFEVKVYTCRAIENKCYIRNPSVASSARSVQRYKIAVFRSFFTCAMGQTFDTAVKTLQYCINMYSRMVHTNAA